MHETYISKKSHVQFAEALVLTHIVKLLAPFLMLVLQLPAVLTHTKADTVMQQLGRHFSFVRARSKNVHGKFSSTESVVLLYASLTCMLSKLLFIVLEAVKEVHVHFFLSLFIYLFLPVQVQKMKQRQKA